MFLNSSTFAFDFSEIFVSTGKEVNGVGETSVIVPVPIGFVGILIFFEVRGGNILRYGPSEIKTVTRSAICQPPGALELERVARAVG